MNAMTSQITDICTVCSTVCSDTDKSKHQTSVSPSFGKGTTDDRLFPVTKISNAENVFIWWRHNTQSNNLHCCNVITRTHDYTDNFWLTFNSLLNIRTIKAHTVTTMGIKGEMSDTVCVTFTLYIYIWVVYSFCLFCCLFIVVTWWVCVVYCVGKWQSWESTGMFGNLMAIYYLMLQLI